MPYPVEPFGVRAGEGSQIESPTGGTVYVKARTETTSGSMTVLEIVVPPKDGPALHSHLREDELWYVLEGAFRFKAGDAVFQAETGGMAFGPRGLPHGFQNVADTTGRLLVVTTPSGMERFFEEYAEHLPGPVDPAILSVVGHAHLVEIVGPPLGVSDPL